MDLVNLAIHNLQERHRFLEMLALWQGYVRNKDLVDQFSITRQQAYQDIRAYQEQHPERLKKMVSGPYNLVRNISLKPPNTRLSIICNGSVRVSFMRLSHHSMPRWVSTAPFHSVTLRHR